MTIRARGLNEFITKTGKIADAMHTGSSWNHQTMARAAAYVHSQVPPYPPGRGSYRRTGTLGREIYDRVLTLGSQVVGVVGSPTVYALWVIWQTTQAWMHRGRWWTLQDVLRKSRDGIIRIYEDGIKQLIK